MALLLVEAPGILAALAAGFLVVCLSLAERISGVPPGTFVQKFAAALSDGRPPWRRWSSGLRQERHRR